MRTKRIWFFQINWAGRENRPHTSLETEKYQHKLLWIQFSKSVFFCHIHTIEPTQKKLDGIFCVLDE